MFFLLLCFRLVAVLTWRRRSFHLQRWASAVVSPSPRLQTPWLPGATHTLPRAVPAAPLTLLRSDLLRLQHLYFINNKEFKCFCFHPVCLSEGVQVLSEGWSSSSPRTASSSSSTSCPPSSQPPPPPHSSR